MDNEQGTQLTDAQDAPTSEGKAADGAGKDPTVSGLNAALNKALEREKALAKRLAEVEPIVEEHKTTKRENAILRKKGQYGDVAPVLDKLFEKGLDPDSIDDDFVTALRLGAGKPREEQQEDLDTPTLNAPRTTRPASNEDALKRMTSEEFWGE